MTLFRKATTGKAIALSGAQEAVSTSNTQILNFDKNSDDVVVITPEGTIKCKVYMDCENMKKMIGAIKSFLDVTGKDYNDKVGDKLSAVGKTVENVKREIADAQNWTGIFNTMTGVTRPLLEDKELIQLKKKRDALRKEPTDEILEPIVNFNRKDLDTTQAIKCYYINKNKEKNSGFITRISISPKATDIIKGKVAICKTEDSYNKNITVDISFLSGIIRSTAKEVNLKSICIIGENDNKCDQTGGHMNTKSSKSSKKLKPSSESEHAKIICE